MFNISYIILYITLLVLTTECIYVYNNNEWRSVVNARLSQDTQINTNDEYRTMTGCQNECSMNEDCLSFAFVMNDGCYIYNTRFGFNGTFLVPASSTTYYEKPIGFDSNNIDTIARYLYYNQERDGTIDTYISRFRSGINGIVSINNDISLNNQIINELNNIGSSRDCAANCLRSGGFMEDGFTKCNSFNYNPNTRICQLLSFGWDDVHTISVSGTNGFQYFDRLIGTQGSGCWISQRECRNDANYTGHFQHDKALSRMNGDNFDIPNGVITWESDCVEMAQWWHEDKCQNPVDVPTIAYWTGDGITPTYIDWNSFDTSIGCVIKLDPQCQSGNERFHVSGNAFRDSIGEEYFAASESSMNCFNRAQEYHSYVCNGNEEQQITLEYPKTGQIFIYPIPKCECDEFGLKIDTESNNIRYCGRKNPSEQCYREIQGNYWSESDILCDDIVSTNGDNVTDCNTMSLSPSISDCYYIRIKGDNTLEPCNKNNEAPMFENGIYHIKIDGSFTRDSCLAYAQERFIACNNRFDAGISQQIKVWYPYSGETSVFPDFGQPYTTTLIRGLNTDAKFVINDPDNNIISLMPIRTGRWMSFTAQTTKYLRAIDIWVYAPYQIELELTLYLGKGITDVEELTSSRRIVNTTLNDIHSSQDNNRGGFVNFMFPNNNIWELKSGNIYTWEITIIMNTGTDDVSIGYDLGDNSYTLGEGDLTWDYLFVTWIEDIQPFGSTQELVTPDLKQRPWFEPWFITGLVLWVLFLIFLILLHLKHKHDQKKEKEEDRQFQRQLRQRIRDQAIQQQTKSLNNNNDNNKKTNDINDDIKEDNSDNDSDNNNGRTKMFSDNNDDTKGYKKVETTTIN